MDLAGDGRAVLPRGVGGLGENAGDGVGRQLGGLAVAPAVEQRPGGWLPRVSGVELIEVDAQVRDGLAGQGDDAGLVPLTREGDVAGLGQVQVTESERGELRYPGRGLVEHDEQHPVAARSGGPAAVCGQDRAQLLWGEVGYRLARLAWGLERLGGLAERDQGMSSCAA